jgi:hypothetical protein
LQRQSANVHIQLWSVHWCFEEGMISHLGSRQCVPFAKDASDLVGDQRTQLGHRSPFKPVVLCDRVQGWVSGCMVSALNWGT